MCLSALIGLGGALLQGASANKAAKAQTRAADQQVQLYRDIYNDTTERFQPFYDSGTNALAAYNYELGIGPRPTFGGTAPTITTIEGKGSTTLGDPRFVRGGGGKSGDRENAPAPTQTPGMPTRYSVNGQHPWRILAQWQNPATGKLHLFHSENLWFDPSRFVATQKQVRVLIDPQQPNRYSMDLSFLPELADH